MNTKIYKVNDIKKDYFFLEEGARCLQNNGLVAFPTETVYGIGANALCEEAIKKIYEAKGRPSDNPLIVHISDKENVYKYAENISDKALKVMKEFWPGPLTIILKKSEKISNTITGGLNTIALRVPNNPIARELIRIGDIPVAAPSANLSGRPSPTIVQHVIEDLQGKVDIIIDGGNTEIGLESTVLDMTTDIPTILRPGKITKLMLEKVVGKVEFDPTLIKHDDKEVPRSPGMKYKHYAPKGKIIVVDGEEKLAINTINQWVVEEEKDNIKVGVISTVEDYEKYQCKIIKVIGSKNNHDEIAANLFALLREMDMDKVEVIYTRPFSEDEIGHATMNRLMKAAGNEIKYV